MSNIVSLRDAGGNIIKLEIHNTLDSTSELAKKYANAGYPDRYAVFAGKRKVNKGTDKKGSSNAYEEGLFLSVILRPSLFPSQASLLGALSATAFILALEDHTSSRLGLGWISDLYCEGNRIGGSSLEGKLDNYTSYEYIIVTFSAVLDNQNFPPRMTDMIRKVFEAENTSISMIIARNILTKFFGLYTNFKTNSKFMDIYTQKLVLRGEKVKYFDSQKKKTGKVLGVNKQNGALILENRKGEMIEIASQKNVVIPKKIKLKKQKR